MLLNLKELTPIEGVNYRGDCPFCGGANTFSMLRIGGDVRYNCFKASCNPKKSRGTAHYRRTPEEIKNSFRNRQDLKDNQEFIIPSYFEFGVVNDKIIKMLRDKNSWDAYERGYFTPGYDPREERLLFFLEYSGRIAGAVGRSLSFHIKPKSKVYPHSKGIFSVGQGNHAVLVEDCFSACSISRSTGLVGVSLNGTNLTKDHLTFLKYYDKVTVALDKDATRKSIKISNQLNFMNIKSNMLFLQEDLKDMQILPNLT